MQWQSAVAQRAFSELYNSCVNELEPFLYDLCPGMDAGTLHRFMGGLYPQASSAYRDGMVTKATLQDWILHRFGEEFPPDDLPVTVAGHGTLERLL